MKNRKGHSNERESKIGGIYCAARRIGRIYGRGNFKRASSCGWSIVFGRCSVVLRGAEDRSVGVGRRGKGSEQKQESDGHWVTINRRNVFIDEAQRTARVRKSSISDRDKAYLEKYYGPVAALAKKYRVDPVLVLGLGFESGFTSAGTYPRKRPLASRFNLSCKVLHVVRQKCERCELQES